jgi:predicted translin family RNA/ssDNA-binding protein
MLGEKAQMWLTKLKIAIIEKNAESLDKLLDDIPELTQITEIEEAVYLLEEASRVFSGLKDEVLKSMNQIQKNLQFLRSTDIPTSRNLDLKS